MTDKHWISVRDTETFAQDSFQEVALSRDQGIYVKIGMQKDNAIAGTVPQAFAFDAARWSMDEASAWVQRHKRETAGIRLTRVTEDCEIRVSHESKWPTITGYAAVFNRKTELFDGYYEEVAPGAFANAIKRDDVRALWNHNADYVLGRMKSGTLKLNEDDKGLKYEVIPPDTAWARDLMTLIKRGDISQSSFGFNIVKSTHEKLDAGKVKRTIQDVVLYDVSPVTFPAYKGTEVHVRMIRNKDESLWYCEDTDEIIVAQTQSAAKPVVHTDEQLDAEWEAVKTAASGPRRR